MREREVSSVELVSAHLERIENLNHHLNAVVALDAPAAQARARELDARLARGDLAGPLHGVPFTLKDWIEAEGLVCAAGFEERRDFVPGRDATIAARLRRAGAVLLGKTVVNDGGRLHPRPNNPYDLARTPGASSSGECVAVAAGLSPVGIGSDSGGSLRFPAHCCGVATLKPTSGRVPTTGHFPRVGHLSDPRTVIGPIARSTGDLWLLLALLAGPDGHDPACAPVVLGDPVRVSFAGLRAAVYDEIPEGAPTPETAATVAAAARALSKAGVVVERERPPRIEESFPITLAYWSRPSSVSWNSWRPGREHRLATPDDVERSLFEWERLARAFLRFMQRYDAIVCPVAREPAKAHGESSERDFLYTLPYSLCGYPCAVVRCGTSSEGLPIGVQVVARPWREDVAVALAGELESALGGWQPPDLSRFGLLPGARVQN